MMKLTRRTVLGGGVAAGLTLIGGLTATGALAGDLTPLNPPQKVTVAYVPIMKFATMYVAANRGIFKKYGLDVDLEKVKSGTEAIAFLNKGSVDVGGIAIVTSLWNSWNRGLDIRIIAPGGLEPMKDSPTALLVSTAAFESGKVKDIADLKGKNVGVAGGPGSGGEYLAAKALERAHLTIRDVNLINISNPDIPAALKAGSVDAALALDDFCLSYHFAFGQSGGNRAGADDLWRRSFVSNRAQFFGTRHSDIFLGISRCAG